MFNSKAAYNSFQKGMKEIMSTVTTKYNAKVVLGGVYPCNGYSNEHYQYLKSMKAVCICMISTDAPGNGNVGCSCAGLSECYR